MNRRGVIRYTLVLWMLIGLTCHTCSADKLSAGLKAPPHATNSGGLGLKAPLAANVGARQDVGRSGGSRPIPAPQVPQQEGVIREEIEDIKEVDGKPVRVVKGKLAYDSPEGLPVSVKYEADENGNRASFTIGAAKLGGGGGGGGGGRSGGGKRPPSGGGGGGGSGGQKSGGPGSGGKEAYLPPMNVDKSYLPPSLLI